MNVFEDIKNKRLNAKHDYSMPEGYVSPIPDIPDEKGENNVLKISDKPGSFDYVDNLPVWEPSSFFKDEFKRWGCFSAIISGNSRSGKSYLLKHLLTRNNNILLNKYDFVVVFSPTLSNGFYKGFIKGKLMFETFDPRIIEALKKKHADFKKKDVHMKWLVILDDCADSKSKYINEIQNLYFSGRHHGASVIFLTQKCSLVNTGWFTNSTLIISLFAGSRREKEYLAYHLVSDNISNDFPEKKASELDHTACLIQSLVCQNYRALVVTPYAEKKIHTYRA